MIPSGRGTKTQNVSVFAGAPPPWALALLWLALACAAAAAPAIDDNEAARLGERIFVNETGGRHDRLVWWNPGEDFPSLGIGHFIWYPQGVEGPFTESFPSLLAHLQEAGVSLPPWLAHRPPCPWPDRAALEAERDGPRVRALQDLLATTFAHQSRFLVARLEAALPRLADAAPPGAGDAVAARLEALLATPAGRYGLVDYVNFKGEGTNPRERYRGEGWGLLQVLLEMADDDPAGAPGAFAAAAARVLERRVANAPPQRGEERWLPGWQRRVAGYRHGP